MKIFILGGAGHLGRALQATAPREAVLDVPARSALDIADCHAAGAWIRANRPDLIFDAAAYTRVDQAESEPGAAGAVNGLAPGWLAQAAHAVGARFVQISTDYVFDGGSRCPYPPGASPNPLNVYGRSKREGELAALNACPDAVVLRTSWLYAREGHNFLNTMLERMRRGEALKVVNDQVGTPTLASSAATALWALARMRVGGVLHYSDGGETSWHDYAVAIREEALHAGLLTRAVTITPVAAEDYKSTARRPAYSVLDCRSTWDLLGAAPPHWRDNLRATIRAMAA